MTATATQKCAEMPQRVRQFVLRQDFESFAFSESVRAQLDKFRGLTPPDVSAVVVDESIVAAGTVPGREEKPGLKEDLPPFLKHRSLRRRLDDAFDSCYRSSLMEWIQNVFSGRGRLQK